MTFNLHLFIGRRNQKGLQERFLYHSWSWWGSMPTYRVESDSNKEERKESEPYGAWIRQKKRTQKLTKVKEPDVST